MPTLRSLAPWAVALALAAGLGAPAPATATTVLDQSVSDLTASAERVVLARVNDVRSWMDRSAGVRISTAVSLEVLESLKGPTEPRLVELVQPGGTAGEGSQRKTQTIPGTPRWVEGETVLVFLEKTDTGRVVTSGLSMGKYTVAPGPDGELTARRDVSELHRLYSRRAPERVVLGAAPSEDALALSALRRLIKGERVLAFPKVLRPARTPAGRVPVTPGAVGPTGGEVRQ
ncbi:hypothetical protein L6V77_26105 [Myxococcota bacterium]|nr:hypothetical protein [Myxococcota bacterium]